MSTWAETRWWRVIYADQRTYPEGHHLAGRLQLWCETSDEDEVLAALETCPGGGILQKLWERVESEWRTQQHADLPLT